MRNRFNNQLSSVNESTSLLKSKLLFRPSKRRRSWISKQSFPSRKQSGFASFFSTGGGEAVDFASICPCPARTEKGQTNAKIKSKAGILVIFPEILVAIFFIKDWQYKNRQVLCKLFFSDFFNSPKLRLLHDYKTIRPCGFYSWQSDIRSTP